MSGIRNVWVPLSLLVAGSSALAEDAGAMAQYFGEFPVVLSASRLVQPVDEAPAAVTVIDRETIRASGARQLAEIFRLVPGFVVTYRNGHAPAVAYHGLADTYARRLQVMVDGVSVYSPLFGGVDWNLLPIAIEDIERIEIVRGPNGASFGANAFVGMVNIITREPTTGQQWQAAGNHGENGIGDWNLGYTGGGEALRYRLSAGQRSDDGFAGRDDNSLIRYANFRGHYQVDSSHELMASLAHTDSEGWEQYEYSRPRHVQDTDLRLRWTRARGEEEFWLQFHHAERRARERYVDTHVADLRPFGGPRMLVDVPVNYDNDLRRDEMEFQQTFAPLAGWRLALGGQWRQDAAHSQGMFNRSDWLSNRLVRVFGSVEWKPATQLLIHGGATYEHTSLTGGALSPRLSSTWTLAPGHVLRAGISQARRTPTLYEEYANQSYPVPANLHAALVALAPNLPPPWNTNVLSPILAQTYLTSGGLVDERILSREIAYLGKLPALGLAGEVRWFSDRTRDLIYLHRVPFPTALSLVSKAGDIRNQDRADIHGLEGSLRWTPWAGADLSVAAARTVIESSDVDVTYSLSAPVHTASVLFRQQLPGDFSVSTAYYRTGPLTWLSGGDPLPAAERLDLRLGKHLRWGRQQLDVDLIVQNVTDEHSPEFDYLRYSRRTAWLRLHYAL
jgi:iron complex outermembrane receptor protein